MYSLILLALSFVPALAAPHGSAHFRLHARDLVAAPLIAGRSTAPQQQSQHLSPIGVCGGDSGFGCAQGFCCSQWGYCGVTADYCGVGCQFGNCGNGTSAPTAALATGSSLPSAALPTANATGLANATHTTRTQSVRITSTVFLTTSTTATLPSSSPASVETQSSSEPPVAVSTTAAPATSSVAETTSAGLVSISLPSPATTFAISVVTTSSASSVAPVTTASPTPTPAISTSSTAAAASTSASSGSSSGGSGTGLGNVYHMYTGSGSTSQGWPTMSDWTDFDSMWQANEYAISQSCTWNGWNVPDNSDAETAAVKSAIQSQSAATGVDSRFILAVVLQESHGCVRVPTTNYGVTNPGLMQSHNGKGSCNSGGVVQNPCPQSEIEQMIQDGTAGTLEDNGGGDGLQQLLAQAGSASNPSTYYIAAVMYNSGSVKDVLNLAASAATPCYATDIANRLTGWTTAGGACT